MAYVRHVTLTANTVQAFSLTDNSSGFEVLNRNGLDEVYVSYDGTSTPANPTVGGNDFDVVPAAVGAATQFRRIGTTAIAIKVISAKATTVSFRSLS